MEASEVLAISRKIVKAVRPYIKAQLAKDAANRYSLKEEWYLPVLAKGAVLPAGEYHGEVVNILSDGAVNLVYYNPFESAADKPICDGASKFPDKVFGVNLVPASIAHDTIYRELEEIAKAFGVPVSAVRKLADQVFASVNLAENRGKLGAKTISTLTFWGVRLFGGIYHRRHVALVLFAIMCFAGGCSGCVGSIFEDDDEYVSPVYEKAED